MKMEAKEKRALKVAIILFIAVYVMIAFYFIILAIISDRTALQENTKFCLEKNYISYVKVRNEGSKTTFYCYKYDDEGFIIKSKERYWYND